MKATINANNISKMQARIILRTLLNDTSPDIKIWLAFNTGLKKDKSGIGIKILITTTVMIISGCEGIK